jgi:hypothetical protein
MYKMEPQLKLEDFVFPYGKLNPENEWVRMAELMPWGAVEEKYCERFVNNGHPAHPARMALGSLIIKRRLKCPDEWVVRHISENPYLQYFIGMKEFNDTCPFGESTLVAFRKRFDEEALCEINDMLLESMSAAEADEHDDEDGPGGNSGRLVLDASCTPSDISYPQDLRLLNEAREKVDEIIDALHAANPVEKRPRTRRRVARRDYLRTARKKRRSEKEMRGAVRKQLGYLYRNIGFVQRYVSNGAALNFVQQNQMNTISLLYEQQLTMYENKTHSVGGRIVSLAQPWIRPIVRGKAGTPVEFGAKLHLSSQDGFVRVERLSFEAFNEACDLPAIVERYRARNGHFPAEILADKLYATRDNRAFCKHHGIRLQGPPLGRPGKNIQRDKKQEYADSCNRNEIEGKFGVGKRAYGLGLLMEKLPTTAFSAICASILTMNLVKLRCAILNFLFMRFFQHELPASAALC